MVNQFQKQFRLLLQLEVNGKSDASMIFALQAYFSPSFRKQLQMTFNLGNKTKNVAKV